MANVKCQDLDDHFIELLKWGWDAIRFILTKVLEFATIYDFTLTWSLRKIVPIHKSGSKDLMTNYWTFMMVVFLPRYMEKSEESVVPMWFLSYIQHYRTYLCFACFIGEVRWNRKDLFCAFIYFKKAFDTIPCEFLWNWLQTIGVP